MSSIRVAQRMIKRKAILPLWMLRLITAKICWMPSDMNWLKLEKKV